MWHIVKYSTHLFNCQWPVACFLCHPLVALMMLCGCGGRTVSSLCVCLSLSVFQLCFASLLAAPRTTVRNVVVTLFLRVLHSFAENVLAFAATHEVGSRPVLGPISRWLCIVGLELLLCWAESDAFLCCCLIYSVYMSGRILCLSLLLLLLRMWLKLIVNITLYLVARVARFLCIYCIYCVFAILWTSQLVRFLILLILDIICQYGFIGHKCRCI